MVAAENRSFWTDKGIDPKGIVRAFFNNASGNAQQGASTITQQYVKILYLTQERSYTRKVKEAILSLKLVRQQSKEEILAGYLNTIYFGRGAYGVQAAAKAFFDKPTPRTSTCASAAVLASVINNPSRFDPANGKDAKLALKERYVYVLNGMAEAEDISTATPRRPQRKLPKFDAPEVDDAYGGQHRPHADDGKKELLRLTNETTGEPFTEEEINGGGLRDHHDLHREGDGRGRAGVAEARPEGRSSATSSCTSGSRASSPAPGRSAVSTPVRTT